jgi:hypothetical protein
MEKATATATATTMQVSFAFCFCFCVVKSRALPTQLVGLRPKIPTWIPLHGSGMRRSLSFFKMKKKGGKWKCFLLIQPLLLKPIPHPCRHRPAAADDDVAAAEADNRPTPHCFVRYPSSDAIARFVMMRKRFPEEPTFFSCSLASEGCSNHLPLLHPFNCTAA